MTDISKFLQDPLLSCLEKLITEENAKEKPRDYVGASGIGGECSRKIWYSLNGYKQTFPAKALMAINDGHRTEAALIDLLKQLPDIELFVEDENGNQYGFEDLGGKYKGHYDGVIRGIPQSPKTWHVLEVKCVSDKYFKEVKKIIDKHGEKDALRFWREEYYAQAVTYMWYAKLTRHLTIVCSAGMRDWLCIRTEQNHKFAKSLKEKAQRIIESVEPPEKIGESTYWKCKMCGFREVCHKA